MLVFGQVVPMLQGDELDGPQPRGGTGAVARGTSSRDVLCKTPK
jgi:hypothetical protein